MSVDLNACFHLFPGKKIRIPHEHENLSEPKATYFYKFILILVVKCLKIA